MISAKQKLQQPYMRIVVPDGDGYSAQILEFPGCVACGDTREEALDNLEKAAVAWIEATKEVPCPLGNMEYSGRFLLRLPKSLHGRLATIAAVNHVSLNQYIMSVLAESAGQTNKLKRKRK